MNLLTDRDIATFKLGQSHFSKVIFYIETPSDTFFHKVLQCWSKKTFKIFTKLHFMHENVKGSIKKWCPLKKEIALFLNSV